MHPRSFGRREALQFAWFGALAVGTVQVGRVVLRAILGPPSPWPGTIAPFVLGRADALPAAGDGPLSFAWNRLWWMPEAGGGIAFLNVCPHGGGDCRYDWKGEQDRFICPCHGSQFERQGRYVAGPAGRDLDRFVVRAYDVQRRVVTAQSDASGRLDGVARGDVIVVDGAAIIRGRRHG